MEYFGFTIADVIPCEICGNRAVDIHHIHARGMGGSKSRDYIENLMALCRDHHNDYGDITELIPFLIRIHTLHIQNKDRVLFETLKPL